MTVKEITTENEIAEAVLKVAKTASGEASLANLKKNVPGHLKLTPADLAVSEKRPPEPMWEQRLRNIKSHAGAEGNYITEGYLTAPSRGRLRITEAGKRRVGA